MVRRSLKLVCLVLTAATTIACGSSSGGGGVDAGDGGSIEGLVSLKVEPADVTLTAVDDTPAIQDFVVTGTFQDGSTRDLTAKVRFVLSVGQLGSFAGGRFSTSNDQGGYSTLEARAGSIIGLGSIKVILKKNAKDTTPGVMLPGDPAGVFGGGGEDAKRAPRLVYPNDGAVLPPNLGKLEVHFFPTSTGGAANNLFAVHFESPVTDVTVFTSCAVPMNGGCIYTPDDAAWRWIAETNRGDTGGVKISVKGADAGGGTHGTSTALNVSFSKDNIEGAIYYWTTSSTSIMRYDFAGEQTAAETYINQKADNFVPAGQTPPDCGVGCHALSRDGKKIVTAGGFGSADGKVILIDIEHAATKSYKQQANAFSSFSPDGAQFVGTFGKGADPLFKSYDLNLFNGDTGAFVSSIPVGGTVTGPATHPDWSPDGKSIAYTKIGVRKADDTSTAQRMAQTSLGMVTLTGTTWGPPVVLKPAVAGGNSCYPAFAPQGDLLAFNLNLCGGAAAENCDCYDDPKATLAVIKPVANATPVMMANINKRGAGDPDGYVPQASYPKWSPFTFRRSGEQGSRLHWITFSSSRNAGLRKPVDKDGNVLRWLWMAAVDPDIGLNGQDPSFPAFYIPFQNLDTSNHTAQWAERVVPPVD